MIVCMSLDSLMFVALFMVQNQKILCWNIRQI